MNNDELKKKFIKIIRQGFADADCRNPYTNVPYPYFDSQIFCIADALIAAGIGDAKEAEHRAKVAERALDLCEDAYVLAINGMRTHGISLQAITSDLGVHGFFMQQSEKELAEESKDD